MVHRYYSRIPPQYLPIELGTEYSYCTVSSKYLVPRMCLEVRSTSNASCASVARAALSTGASAAQNDRTQNKALLPSLLPPYLSGRAVLVEVPNGVHMFGS